MKLKRDSLGQAYFYCPACAELVEEGELIEALHFVFSDWVLSSSPVRCSGQIENDQIRFDEGCNHRFAGQELALPEIEDDPYEYRQRRLSA